MICRKDIVLNGIKDESHVAVVPGEWHLSLFTSIKTRIPRFIGVRNIKDKKEYKLYFNATIVKYVHLSKAVPEDIVNKIKEMLSRPGALQIINQYWANNPHIVIMKLNKTLGNTFIADIWHKALGIEDE